MVTMKRTVMVSGNKHTFVMCLRFQEQPFTPLVIIMFLMLIACVKFVYTVWQMEGKFSAFNKHCTLVAKDMSSEQGS
jgi:hypothetical protein